MDTTKTLSDLHDTRYTYNKPKWIIEKEVVEAKLYLKKYYTRIIRLSTSDQAKYTEIYEYEIAHNGEHRLDSNGYNIIPGNRFQNFKDFIVKNNKIIAVKKLIKK